MGERLKRTLLLKNKDAYELRNPVIDQKFGACFGVEGMRAGNERNGIPATEAQMPIVFLKDLLADKTRWRENEIDKRLDKAVDPPHKSPQKKEFEILKSNIQTNTKY